jgi:hypothetical protein
MEIFEKIKLPDQSLIAHVNGNYDEQDNWFNKGGYLLALHLKLACLKILKKPLSDFHRIFDFGVGCNRIFGRIPTIQNQISEVIFPRIVSIIVRIIFAVNTSHANILHL